MHSKIGVGKNPDF